VSLCRFYLGAAEAQQLAVTTNKSQLLDHRPLLFHTTSDSAHISCCICPPLPSPSAHSPSHPGSCWENGRGRLAPPAPAKPRHRAQRDAAHQSRRRMPVRALLSLPVVLRRPTRTSAGPAPSRPLHRHVCVTSATGQHVDERNPSTAPSLLYLSHTITCDPSNTARNPRRPCPSPGIPLRHAKTQP
jgi:hypothetical protein